MGNLFCGIEDNQIECKCKELAYNNTIFKLRIKDLERENKSLKICIQKNSELMETSRLEVLELRARIQSEELKKDEMKKRSKELIQEFVKTMLEDENINIKGIPDCIERKIYENVLTLLLRMMDKILGTTDIHLLNHHIVFDVIPKE